ncbi:MAG: threonylcarbamoyl-AMP synthase [Luteitalea sp.]|nr:threonylcarbamoyl-AMP synthase [Luteitalea sp.]
MLGAAEGALRAVLVRATTLARERRPRETRLRAFAFGHGLSPFSSMSTVEVYDVRHAWAHAVSRAARLLRAGRVVAYPTDTLYALGAAADEPHGVADVIALKARTPDKTVPILAASLEQVAARVGPLSPLGLQLARRFWPGPLTLVMTATHFLAPGVVHPDGSVAVRVPASRVARALAASVDGPVTSTSANRAGGPPAQSVDEVVRLFGPRLALILDGGPAREVTPSTIVDVRDTVPHLLRSGAVPWKHVLESLE